LKVRQDKAKGKSSFPWLINLECNKAALKAFQWLPVTCLGSAASLMNGGEPLCSLLLPGIVFISFFICSILQ